MEVAREKEYHCVSLVVLPSKVVLNRCDVIFMFLFIIVLIPVIALHSLDIKSLSKASQMLQTLYIHSLVYSSSHCSKEDLVNLIL